MVRAALFACWPLALGLVVVCLVLALLVQGPMSRIPGRRSLAEALNLRLWTLDLHRDERGSVQSLSFVLTAPLFIMLLMLAVQITQLMIGEIIVNYAAYAAARSATVSIPMRIEQPMLELGNWLNLREMTGSEVNSGVGVSPKMVLIHRSAALACLPIAPSRDLGRGDVSDTMTQAILAAYNAYSTAATSNSRLPKRLANKWAYALDATTVQISTFHRRYGTSQSSYQNEPPLWDSNPLSVEAYYKPTEIGWRDEVTVKVTHNFALLPGPGRLLANSAASNPQTAATNRIQQAAGVYYVPLSATATMVPEGEKSIAPYVHQPFWP